MNRTCRRARTKSAIIRSLRDRCRIGLTAILGLTILLAGCATAPPPPPPEPAVLLEARSATAQGDWSAAGAAWEQVARTEADSRYAWMESAEAWWKAGNPGKAQEALAQIQPGDLFERRDRAREALLRGELALAAGDYDEAARYLALAGDGLPSSERRRLQRAETLVEEQRRDPAAVILADVNATLEDSLPGTVNAVSILQQLEAVPASRLAMEAQRPSRLGQWCALSLDMRQTLLEHRDPLTAASAWQEDNPLHPIGEQEYLEIAWQYGQRFTPPGRVAVLLPTTGRLAVAGNAIRDGLVSAWLDHPTRSELTFLPVGEDPQSALDAYYEAEQGGFSWVIGPLRRESVNLVAQQPGASVPGLLLNWPELSVDGDANTDTPQLTLETPPPAQQQNVESPFFSLSLSQEAEAAAVANQMLARGHAQAILLLMDGAWGERIEAAFMDAYLAGGGEIISLERFDAETADHSGKLTRLLQIQDGRQRVRRLQNQLDLPLEFEDSRRDDFGAFFMAADPALGRQLKPQLKFFDAGSKPVFAMSRVFAGDPDPRRDGDLDGIVIPTTRWMLANEDSPSETSLNSLRNGAFASLFALGRDAWDILPWLDLMSRNPEMAYPGTVGDLRIDAEGRVQREPAWAIFERGRPVPLEPIPAPTALTGMP